MESLMAGSYGLKLSGIDVIRTGVDLEKFAGDAGGLNVRSRHGIRNNSFLLLCLSILMPHRRLEDAIEAVQILRSRNLDVQLVIVGSFRADPSYVKALQNQIRESSLDRDVLLVGAIPDDEISTYYHACDAFIFPNEDQTWGLAVIEAMICGKPVIVSTGAGVHEVLIDGVTGLLVPPRSPRLLAHKVEGLIADPAVGAMIAASGRSYVRANFSWVRYAAEMGRLFKEAVSDSHARAALSAPQRDARTLDLPTRRRQEERGVGEGAAPVTSKHGDIEPPDR
jgi:glycosyltransferase involved in cell wall biosynthesis